MRVIPAMDLLGGRVVRLHKGDYAKVTVYHDDPMAVVDRFVAEGAAWLHVVDLDGARDGSATQASLVERILARHGATLRVQVGGGVRTLDRVRAYAAAGATRVVVGTRAAEDPSFVTEAARLCGVVAAVDARDGVVSTHGWTVSAGVTAIALAKTLTEAGACAVLYTDIARDGTGEGPNVEATAALARALGDVEVIASGGIGSLDHLRALAARPEIASCVVGRALYDKSLSLPDALEVGK